MNLACRVFSSLAVIFFLFVLTNIAEALPGSPIALAPSAPATTGPIFTVSWNIGPGGYFVHLQEKAPAGNWQIIVDFDDQPGSIILTRTIPGTYQYRTVLVGANEEVYSSAISVEVLYGEIPELDSPATQAEYQYEVRVGDIDNNGYQDAYVRRLDGDLDNGVIADQIIVRQSTNRFNLLNASALQIDAARLWPIAPMADVLPANLNLDSHVDLAIRGLTDANPQILISSGEYLVGSASQLGEFDEASEMFVRDTWEYFADPNYFDVASTPDEPGYNIRIDAVIGYCYYFYGFPVCVEEEVVLADIDVSLEDLGLDSFLFSPANQTSTWGQKVSTGGVTSDQVGAFYSPEIHAAAGPTISEQGIGNLAAYSSESSEAMQRVGPSLPDISNDPDILRCVYWCGGQINYDSYGYSYFYWVDTWTPITIPGDFDSDNFSLDAYNFSQEYSELDALGFVQVLTYPVAQRALERAAVIVIGAVGATVIVEDVMDAIEKRIEEYEANNSDAPAVDPAFEVLLEEIIGVACVGVVDPADCTAAMEGIFEDEVGQNGSEDPLPSIIGSRNVDTNQFDEDWMALHFPVIGAIVSRLKNPLRWNCTYKKYHAGTNTTYYGRTSAPEGGDCASAIAKRDQAHRILAAAGFALAIIDAERTGVTGYAAIRGREQQLIDSWMVDGRNWWNVANVIRGVAKANPAACIYHVASDVYIGPLSPYTAFGSCP